MAVVASVDYDAKRIYLSAATVGVDLDTLDIYKEVRALRRTTDLHQQYRPMIIAGGNLEKIAGVSYTPAYVQLLYGCRIVPYNVSQKLRVVRDTFTDDGFAGRDCFDRTPLSPAVKVDIDVDFPEIEIRRVTVGSAVTPADITAITASVWAAAVRTLTSAGTATVDPQVVRDALKLAASAGAPDVDSIDDKLDKIKSNTNLIPALL